MSTEPTKGSQMTEQEAMDRAAASLNEDAFDQFEWNAEALRRLAVAIKTKDEQIAELEADVEICMDALEHLKTATFGPALLSNLGDAAQNEVELRIEYAEKQQKRTSNWKQAEAALAAKETTGATTD